MEVRTDKPNVEKPNSPPKSAYVVLAGIFLASFAVIYIALVLRVHFLTVKDGTEELSETAANLIFAFALLTILGAMYLYIAFSRKELMSRLKEPTAFMSVFTVVVTANIFIAYVNPYGMLISLTALLVLPFSKRHDAFTLNVFASLISSFTLVDIVSNRFAVVSFTAISGVLSGAIGVYAFPTAMTRVKSVFRAFVTVLSAMAMYVVFLSVYSLSVEPLVDNFMYIGITAAGQMLLATFLEPIIESVFNVTTDFKLVELTSHKQPLIHRLIVEAPGTFNHSIAVANFAEICATAIGENPYFARACAYYHDVGKLNNAMYFTENQSGYNPHNDILPEVSAEIIRQHTVDGYNLCKEHRIPEEIARATIEHQGTLPITYFYNKAKSLTDGEVDMEEYRYHGDTPRGKVSAILMICDSAEAAIRAMDNPDGEKVDRLLKAMIDERLRLGQFDKCAITMQELNTIRAAIVGAYGGLYHKRIKYNTGAQKDDAHV
ncbi:MAG: HDIG domain-containing protein [Clostridiales bacterium]|nr:HDIG domain-containing protein [Clostridiales bacterium]